MWLSFGGSCCVGLLERDRKRGKRDGRVEKEIEFFILFIGIVCNSILF